MQVLEREIGGSLFERRRNGVALTGFGRFVLERVQLLVSSHNQLSREIEQFKGGESGTLHVGFGPLPAETLGGHTIARFQTEHPRVKLRVSFPSTDEMVDSIKSGRIEVIVGEPELRKDEPDLVRFTLKRRPGFLFCRSGHPLLQNQSPSLTEVADYPFVGFKLSAEFAHMAEPKGRFGFVDPATGDMVPKVECYSMPATKQIVAASNCIGAATLSMIWREIRDGELAPIALVIPGFETAYSIVTWRGRTLSSEAQAFIDIVRQIDAETEELLPRWLGTKSRYLETIARRAQERVSAKKGRARVRRIA